MENKNASAFPNSEWKQKPGNKYNEDVLTHVGGLTKEQYACIHISASPPIEFINKFIEGHPDPEHPGTVARMFSSKETDDGKPYAKFIQNYFDAEEGQWTTDADVVIPEKVKTDVNSHVAVIKKYYSELEEFKINRFIKIEVAWRRKVGIALMESFDKK